MPPWGRMDSTEGSRIVRRLVVILLLASACHPKVRKAFDERRAATLAPLRAPAAGWAPDAAVQLSSTIVGDAAWAALRGARLAGPVPVDGHDVAARLEPVDLLLDLPSAPCSGCTGVIARLRGEVEVDGEPLGARVDVVADLELSHARQAGAHALRLRPDRVTGVDVRWDGVPPRPLLRADRDPLAAWVARRLEVELPPVRLGHVGRERLPLAAVALRVEDDGPRVDVRTGLADTATVPAPPAPGDGWTARIGVDTVLGLARRALLAAGPRRGLWADPVVLDLGDDAFHLVLRLWRPAAGWYVDLDVTGRVEVIDGRVTLDARALREVASSEGARWLDPIEVVRDTDVLRGIADALTSIMPAGEGTATVEVTWRVTDLEVVDRIVTLRGEAAFEPR